MRNIAATLVLSTLLSAPAWADSDPSLTPDNSGPAPKAPAASARKKEKQPAYIMDTSGIGQSHNGVVAADQILELGVLTPNALQLEAEQSLRMGNLNRALMVLQRSIEMSPLDVEARMTYADALEQLLNKQDKRDPKLFNFIVKQWLFVAKKAEFPDQKMQAYARLNDLTGQMPKQFEKTTKYLSRVLLPEDGSTPVALGQSNPKKKKKDDLE